MKHGMVDPKGVLHELAAYEIEGLCKAMMQTAIESDENYRKAYEDKYKNRFTYFSEALEFCVHELGWKLYDPFCLGKEEVLFSNGSRSYVAPLSKLQEPGFDPKKVTATDIGYCVLTDKDVNADRTLTNINYYDDGIVSDRGFVSSSFVNGDLNSLAQVILMHEFIKSKEMYDHYLANRHHYTSQLDYLTSLANVIAIDKQENGKFSIRFVSENDGKVLDFINALTMSGMLQDLEMMKTPEAGKPMEVAEAGMPMPVAEAGQVVPVQDPGQLMEVPENAEVLVVPTEVSTSVPKI